LLAPSYSRALGCVIGLRQSRIIQLLAFELGNPRAAKYILPGYCAEEMLLMLFSVADTF